MPPRVFQLDHTQHTALFAALSELMRDLARLASGSEPSLLIELDLRLAQGWMSTFQFSIARAGALGCSLVLANKDGHAYEILNIDAPSTDVPFIFNTPSAQA